MDAYEARMLARAEIEDMTARLVAEFDAVPPGTVIGHVARAREELLRAGVRDGLAPAIESKARSRLGRLMTPHV